MTHVVVVGAGTAGCVVAARLVERGDHEVTLIEAGPDGRPGPTPSYLDAMAAPGWMWAAPYPQGRGVGGSSAVNGMLAGLPAPEQLDRLGLSAADLTSAIPADPAADDELGPLDRGLLAAAADSTRVPLARRDRVRWSVAEAYLGPPRDNARIIVRPDAAVRRVVLDGRRAVGVQLVGGEQVRADTVVVAAGALHSPALLCRSGLEDPAVGAGLRDHPSVAIDVRLRPAVVPDPHSLVTGTAWRGGGIEVLPMNHVGPDRPGFAAVLAAVLDPESAGRVVVPADPDAEPVAAIEWSATDRSRLAAAERDVRELLARPALAAVIADVAPLARPGAYAHACGSCVAVVDGTGAVRGVDGLYVCDASTLPELPAAGTMLVAVAWAQRFARRFPAG